MNINENHPEEKSGRAITIYLTRDTFILTASLLFLIGAICLALFYPLDRTPKLAASSTASATNGAKPVALGTVTSPSVQQVTAVQQVTVVVTNTPLPNQPTPIAVAAASSGLNTYPAPQSNVSSAVNGYPAPQSAPFATSPIFSPDNPGAPSTPPPVFNPIRPQSNIPDTPPTPTIPVFGQQNQQDPGTQSNNTQPSGKTPKQTSPTSKAGGNGNVTQAAGAQSGPAFALKPQTGSNSASVHASAPQLDAPATPPALPEPTDVPATPLTGVMRWTNAHPILIRSNQVIVRGATLVIDPGTQVYLAPGVSLSIQGALYANGTAAQPIRFSGFPGITGRWEGIFGRAGSTIALQNTEITQGGAGGTVLTSESGNLVLQNSRIVGNGGHIKVTNSHLEVRGSVIAGNEMPYDPALQVTYTREGLLIVTDSRIADNQLATGTVPLQVTNSGSPLVTMYVQRNVFGGLSGPDVALFTSGQIQGELTCNTLVKGENGLSVHSATAQDFQLALQIHNNAIEGHAQPINPNYLKAGYGRGSTSEIPLDMSRNWWGDPTGPYSADRHADGRGDAIGLNILFAPWLNQRPACAPQP